MPGWHHWCKGNELGQTLEDGERQGGLVCYSPWVTKNQTRLGNWNTSTTSKIYKQSIKIQYQKIKLSNFKTGRKSELPFFQIRHTDGRKTHEKMINTANNQINANQNHNEISHHIYQNGYYKKENPHLVSMWIKGNTDTHSWWEYKLVQSLWKTVWRFLKT